MKKLREGREEMKMWIKEMKTRMGDGEGKDKEEVGQPGKVGEI